ncbi:MAG: hypothetical protein AB7G75_34310 [Candidatus Binatia bacterium]
MKYQEKIKEALGALQQIPGVEACWLEAEEGDIFHVYTVTREADYDLDTRIFAEYARIEAQFPEASFEFLITSQRPSPRAEVVFSSSRSDAPLAAVAF